MSTTAAVVLVHDHPQRDTFPQQFAFLEARIIPMLQGMPGFHSGQWGYDRERSRTHSYVVFDSARNAQALVDHIRTEDTQPNPFGVKLVSVTLIEHSLSK